MANINDAKGALEQRKQQQQSGQVPATTPEAGLKLMITDNFKAIQSLVPKHVTPERLARLALNAASRNPKLFECDPATVIGAIINCAALGLEPNLAGQAYILPFYNGKTKRMEAQFQIGVKGALDLSRRSGELQEIYAHEVYEGDTFSYSYGLNKDLEHIPCGESDESKVTHFYAVYKLKDGGRDFVVMTRSQVEAHRDRFTKSKYQGSVIGPWKDHFVAMGHKTVLIKLLKFAPFSIEREDGGRQVIGELVNSDNSVSQLKQSSVSNDSFMEQNYIDVQADPEQAVEPTEIVN